MAPSATSGNFYSWICPGYNQLLGVVMNRRGSAYLFIFLSMAWVPLWSTEMGVDPPKVHALLQQVGDEVALLRFEMGAPDPNPWDVQITGASPIEVYDQVRTLYEKADQLCFEQTRERGVHAKLSKDIAQSEDVFRLVEAAHQRLLVVKAFLGIREETTPHALDSSRTPSDVFVLVLALNRSLNLLLDHPFTPADVFQQVTSAVNHCAGLLALYPELERLPGEPAYRRGKQPSDVFDLLLSCLHVTRSIGESVGIQFLTIEFHREKQRFVSPGDVYDLATLVLTEIKHLHARVQGARQAHPAFYPGRKLPAHAFQRAGLLQLQLQSLWQAVQADPDNFKAVR